MLASDDTLEPAPWNNAGLKNAASPFFNGSCVVRLEVLPELRQPPGEVARDVLVGVRQVHRRSALERHVGVCDRPLQRQHRREQVHVPEVPLDDLVGQET